MNGRPPTPNEIKRRRGTARADRGVKPAADVAVLAPAEGIPPVPLVLERNGRDLWNRVWASGVSWVSPVTDSLAVEAVCQLADDLQCARNAFRSSGDTKDGRLVAIMHKELMSGLSAIGFDPTSRTRLGVAEVKRLSKVDELIARRSG